MRVQVHNILENGKADSVMGTASCNGRTGRNTRATGA